MTPSIVHQLLLLPQTLSRPRSIAVAVGAREGMLKPSMWLLFVFVRLLTR